MKLILVVIAFFAAVLTGGIYYFVRKPEAKKSDLGYVKSFPGKVGGWVKSVGKSTGKFLTDLFATKPAAETEATA
jgi:hypothetical protein